MEQTFERLHKQIEDIGTLLKSKEIYGEELILSKIYSYVKSISGEYYDGKEMSPDYRFIRMAIDRAEGTTFGKILNVPVEFDLDDTKEKDNFIEDLVHKAREYLVLKCWWYNGRVPFEKMNFANECLNAANYVKGICDKQGITSHILEITPGYDPKARLYGNDGLGFHYANVVLYEGKYYLIDTTYSQFFYLKHNLLNRIGLVFIPPCAPGCKAGAIQTSCRSA